MRGRFSWVFSVLAISTCRSRYARDPAILIEPGLGSDGVVVPGRPAIYSPRAREGGVTRNFRKTPRFRCREGRLRGTYTHLLDARAAIGLSCTIETRFRQAISAHSTDRAGKYPRNYPLQPDDGRVLRPIVSMCGPRATPSQRAVGLDGSDIPGTPHRRRRACTGYRPRSIYSARWSSTRLAAVDLLRARPSAG